MSCDLLAPDNEQRKRHRALTEEIISKHLEIQEFPDGNGIRFPHDTFLFRAVSELAILERPGRPFLTLNLELKQDRGPVWLRASGSEGVKAFLRAELGDLGRHRGFVGPL